VDKTQDSKRRHFSPHEKVAVVNRHLLERVPISAICEELKAEDRVERSTRSSNRPRAPRGLGVCSPTSS
jgi:transposase-like protein